MCSATRGSFARAPGPTASCARARTRSRAGPPRSSRTSWPSGSSACPSSAEGSGVNFDFSDDQQAIKRTAKELLANRFTAEKVRELAEAGRYDDDAWRELSELGWPGIFIPEEHGGQGLGT